MVVPFAVPLLSQYFSFKNLIEELEKWGVGELGNWGINYSLPPYIPISLNEKYCLLSFSSNHPNLLINKLLQIYYLGVGEIRRLSHLTSIDERPCGQTPFEFNSLLKSGNPPNATVSPRRRKTQGNAAQERRVLLAIGTRELD